MDCQFKLLACKDERYNLFLESQQFLTDSFINSLINKSITLGFQWEIIKEIFYRLFISIKLDLTNKDNINYSRLIDGEKYFEQLISLSNQYDHSLQGKNLNHSSSSNGIDPDDYEDNDEENNTNEMDNDDEHELYNDFNKLAINQDMKKIKPVQKPLTAQQKMLKEQEFIMQSINRINDKDNLRPIIVDGNDVGSSVNKQFFKISRIKQVVDFFLNREHEVYVILPAWRRDQITSSNQSQDQSILNEIEGKLQERLNWTPYKKIGPTKYIKCNDDNFIIKLTLMKKGVIVSNDSFKDFLNKSEEIRQLIEERVLMYTFIDESFMPAEDPLGKSGPNLDNFLRIESYGNQQYMKKCPYRKKCTYGSKCKFWHPERGPHQSNQLFKTAHQSVLEDANEQKMRLEFILNKNQADTINSFDNKKIDQETEAKTENDFKKLEDIKTETKLTFAKIKQKMPEFNAPQPQAQSMNNFFNRIEKPMPELRAMGPNMKINPNMNNKHQFEPKKQQFFNNNMNNKSNYQINNNNKNNFLWDQNKMGLMDNKVHMDNFGPAPGFQQFMSGQMMTSGNHANSELRAQLAPLLAPHLIDKVLKIYKDETDVDKLLFLARGLEFNPDDY